MNEELRKLYIAKEDLWIGMKELFGLNWSKVKLREM